MKTVHHISFFIILSALLYSCSAPYKVSTSVRIKYNWVVSNINIEGDLAGTTINTPVFEDVTIPCLQGSKWSFFEDGGGTYTINSSDTVSCLKGPRKITWEVVTLKGKSNYVQFYRYNAPKGILADRYTLYIAQLAQLSKTSMVLKYPIKYQDKTGAIAITFNQVK